MLYQITVALQLGIGLKHAPGLSRAPATTHRGEGCYEVKAVSLATLLIYETLEAQRGERSLFQDLGTAPTLPIWNKILLLPPFLEKECARDSDIYCGRSSSRNRNCVSSSLFHYRPGLVGAPFEPSFWSPFPLLHSLHSADCFLVNYIAPFPRLQVQYLIRTEGVFSSSCLNIPAATMSSSQGGKGKNVQQPRWVCRDDGYWSLIPDDGILYYQGSDGQMYPIPRIIDIANGLEGEDDEQRLLEYLISNAFYNRQGEQLVFTRATVTYVHEIHTFNVHVKRTH